MQIGRTGEKQAARYLEERGVTVLTMNYHTPYGEIDIIGKKGDLLVFCEVKTRTSQKYGFPEESITARKKNALINSSLFYLQENDLLDSLWRIDVISILKKDHSVQYDWIENAVTSE
jgi:putative endonuclease